MQARARGRSSLTRALVAMAVALLAVALVAVPSMHRASTSARAAVSGTVVAGGHHVAGAHHHVAHPEATHQHLDLGTLPASAAVTDASAVVTPPSDGPVIWTATAAATVDARGPPTR